MRMCCLLPDGKYKLIEGDRELIVTEAKLKAAEATFFKDVIVSPVPESVTPLQMRKAIRHIGLKATVDQFLETLGEETVEAWEYATSIDRNNPFVTVATTGLQMTDDQIDDLFRLAATL